MEVTRLEKNKTGKNPATAEALSGTLPRLKSRYFGKSQNACIFARRQKQHGLFMGESLLKTSTIKNYYAF